MGRRPQSQMEEANRCERTHRYDFQLNFASSIKLNWHALVAWTTSQLRYLETFHRFHSLKRRPTWNKYRRASPRLCYYSFVLRTQLAARVLGPRILYRRFSSARSKIVPPDKARTQQGEKCTDCSSFSSIGAINIGGLPCQVRITRHFTAEIHWWLLRVANLQRDVVRFTLYNEFIFLTFD